MKKLILTLAVIVLAVSAFAQENTNVPSSESFTPSFTTYQAYEFNSALQKENILLDRRTYALITFIAGDVLMYIGTNITDENGYVTDGGVRLALVGGVATITGAVWLIVNEFKLIETRKKINNNLMLSVSPTGVRLNF